MTLGLQAPEWACNTYRAMLDGLKQLEGDLHQHIPKENNVLFPKAIGREAELAAGRAAEANVFPAPEHEQGVLVYEKVPGNPDGRTSSDRAGA